MFSSPLTSCSLDPDPGCGVEALEPGTLLIADAAAFNALYDIHPVFDRLGRRMGEWWLGRKEQRARSFQLQDARDRYLGFIRDHGDLVQRIPQYHIASYLGITDVSLSRIRRDLARAGQIGSAASRIPAAGPAPLAR
jgi:CRP-like cAMP-binding protein